MGSILGYSTAFIDFPVYLPWLGDSQMKGICAVAAVAMGSTVGISCFSTGERRFELGHGDKKKMGIPTPLRELIKSFGMVPRKILMAFAV